METFHGQEWDFCTFQFEVATRKYSYETNETLPGKSLERREKSPKKAFWKYVFVITILSHFEVIIITHWTVDML